MAKLVEVMLKDALDAFVHQGVARIELTDTGVLVYAFYDLQHIDGKQSAKDVMDV